MKFKSIFFATVTCVGVLALSGCITHAATIGKDFNGSVRTQLVKGKTTKAQIVKLFGEPTNKDFNNDGNKVWAYTYASLNDRQNTWTNEEKLTGHAKKLVIIFNKNETVKDFLYQDRPISGHYHSSSWY